MDNRGLGVLPPGRDIINSMKKLLLKSKSSVLGSFVIKTWDSKTGKLLWQSKPIKNKVVSSSGYGRNIVIRNLVGDDTYQIEIDGAIIGTGTTAPADSDTGLVTPTTLTTISVIPVASYLISNDTVIISFFVTDADLPNGTYKEFGMKCGSQLFSRALITPNFTKGSNQNTSIDYTIQLTG